ncbi:hypothetical protein HII31_03427 [Pseudocercospora fuligena]|uniref:Uncharacterized protein n=1 Tax=Pseudocercospora fuligena TaxID=685502 RepID=A0A8H6RQD2_9PEZI|nr:hypothetical protein HII31_03427 [Pseudocercospora fuligena]
MDSLTVDLTLGSLFSEQFDTMEQAGDHAPTMQECLFLERIPSEIRNRIYEYALTGDDGEATLQFCVLIPKPPTLTREQRRDKETAKLARLERHNETLSQLYTELRSARTDAEEQKVRIKELEEDLREMDWDLWYKTDKMRALDRMRIGLANLEGDVSRMYSRIAVEQRDRENLLYPEEMPTHPKDPCSVYTEEENVRKATLSFRDIDNMFALSRTCRQIYQECSALVYEYNEIKFVSRNAVERSSCNDEFLDQDLKHIVQQHTKNSKLRNGVVIDLGSFESLPGSHTFNAHIRKNQESLRKLQKSCKSLTLQYRSQGVAFKLLLNRPESVLTQVDDTMARRSLGWADVRSMKERLLTLFRPAWALHNASKIR